MATFTVLQRGGRYFLCLLFFGFFSLCCLSAMSMSSSPSSSLSPSNGSPSTISRHFCRGGLGGGWGGVGSGCSTDIPGNFAATAS